MNESLWNELKGKQVRFRGRGWELTGRVDVKGNGELLSLEASQVGSPDNDKAYFHFENNDGSRNLNPGDLGEHFDQIKKTGNDYLLQVKKDGATYEYTLNRLVYQ